ncbi:MAG: HAMP domain-containing histidine kinase [Bacteroidetes bacterium]|nr:HAMP domain-containing histidine kinase [Bacteroidota bacterium]
MRAPLRSIRQWYAELPRVHPVRLTLEYARRFFLNTPKPGLGFDVDLFLSGRLKRLERRMLRVRALGGLGGLSIGGILTWPEGVFLWALALIYVAGLWGLWRKIRLAYRPVRARWFLGAWDGLCGLGLFTLETGSSFWGWGLLGLFLYVFYADARLVGALGAVWGLGLIGLGGLALEEGLLWVAGVLLASATAYSLRHQWAHYVQLQHRQTTDALRSNFEALRRGELERLDAMKRQFITLLSHELRTPVTPITSALEMMGPYVRTQADLQELWSIASEAAGRLSRLVQDYTQLAELLLEEQPVSLWEADVGAIARAVVQRVLPSVQSQGHEMQCVIPDSPLLAHTNSPLLETILEALFRRVLGAPQERIRLRLELAAHSPGELSIRFWDSFTLVSESDVIALEDPFGLTAERAYFTRASGLELTLVRRALERLRGRWTIRSQAGWGTEVTLYIPRNPVADRHGPEKSRLRFAFLGSASSG